MTHSDLAGRGAELAMLGLNSDFMPVAAEGNAEGSHDACLRDLLFRKLRRHEVSELPGLIVQKGLYEWPVAASQYAVEMVWSISDDGSEIEGDRIDRQDLR